MMKMKLTYAAMATLIFILGATAAFAQTNTSRVQGRITDGGKPVPDAEVVLTNPDTGKTYKFKTDKNGQFSAVGVVFGIYDEEISDASGQKLFKKKNPDSRPEPGSTGRLISRSFVRDACRTKQRRSGEDEIGAGKSSG